jgi:phosphonate metabolism protein PhnN/1,5-bisphosphokinase (PRPP-forming)
MRAAGDLAWYWEANGHGYGVRAAYRQDIARGRVVVVNGSREHAAALAHRQDVRSVLVTAGAEVLRQRLLARGREGEGAVALRLARNATVPQPVAERVIVNDGGLEAAGRALRDLLLEMSR